MFPLARGKMHTNPEFRGNMFLRIIQINIGLRAFRKLATGARFCELPIDVIQGTVEGQPTSARRSSPSTSPGPIFPSEDESQGVITESRLDGCTWPSPST